MRQLDEHAAETVDHFDHHSAGFARHRYDWYREIREEHGPVFWSPHYGGYWVVIGLEELTEAARDWGTFSSRYGPDAAGNHYDGLFAPPQEQARILIQQDPPEWTVSRRALAQMFSPPAVARWRERIQRLVDACLDRRIESGSVDFVLDVTRPVSGVLSLELAGLPTEDHAVVAETYGLATHLPADDPRWAGLMANFEAEYHRIEAAIDRHETERGEDVISVLLDCRDAGAPFTREAIHDLTHLVVGAGLDTTAALIGSSLVTLARRPDARRQLVEHPELLETALDELTRHGTPTQGLLRTVTKDVELGGRHLRAGERVMLCYGAADRDPRTFPDPDEIVLDRPTAGSVAFGSGIHKCLGIHFAKMEFELVIRTVLARMPDFEVDLAAVEPYDSVGIVAGWTSIPATFTPGPIVGADPGVPGWSASSSGAR